MLGVLLLLSFFQQDTSMLRLHAAPLRLCPCTLAYGSIRPAPVVLRAVLPSRRLHISCHAPDASRVDVVVVGGGAAGMVRASLRPRTHTPPLRAESLSSPVGLQTAAWFAAEAGASVTVLERTREAGKKILMSGGSRW